MSAVTIDIFADLICPWCFIGSARLSKALAATAGEVEVEICYHPFVLEPGAPRSGASVADRLRRKHGVEPQQLLCRVEQTARQSGIDLDLSRQTLLYPTQAAHTLVRHAHPKGTQPALVRDLYRAYFQDALNIADPHVLAEVARRHGFEREETLELATSPCELELTLQEARDAAECGIVGVPFFIFNGTCAISGAQPATVLESAIRRSLERPSDAPLCS